jgi:hypothetical protein
MIRRPLLAALASAAILTSAPGGAAPPPPQKHALLIGIGDYLYDVPDLEGPPSDLATLKHVLIDLWKLPPANVKVLADGEATKANILAAFDALGTTTRPGDAVFIYYSGHGTSSYERSDLGLDNSTGALVPADFRLTSAKPSEDLIVGNRDLRPRLEKLDQSREILAVFDSCYSGAAVRSLRARGKPRYVELPRPRTDAKTRSLGDFPTEKDAAFGSETEKALPFPYTSLIYISAASKSEAARDITREDIARGELLTVDGKPHGALTNSLIEALSGAADSNGDRTLSYGELYSYVREHVSETFPHQPQLLAPEAHRDAVLAKSILATKEAPAATAPTPPRDKPGVLRVKLEGVGPGLAKSIRGTAGLSVVEAGPHDILVVETRDGVTLHHASGDVLASLGKVPAEAVIGRLQTQLAVQKLLDFEIPGQDFNLDLTLPGNRGFLRKGDTFAIEASAEREAVFLLMDVDTSGHVSVLYPFSAAELGVLRRLRVPPAPDTLRVSAPFGTEYLKVVAFAKKPAGIETWMKASFDANEAALGRLLDWLRATSGSRATARLKVVTLESGS